MTDHVAKLYTLDLVRRRLEDRMRHMVSGHSVPGIAYPVAVGADPDPEPEDWRAVGQRYLDRNDWTKKVLRRNEVLATIFAVAIWSLVAAAWWWKIQPM